MDEHFEDTDYFTLEEEKDRKVEHILRQLKETVRMVEEIVPLVNEQEELKQFIGTLGGLIKEFDQSVLSVTIETSAVEKINCHGSPDRPASQRYSPYRTPQKSGLGLGEIVFTN